MSDVPTRSRKYDADVKAGTTSATDHIGPVFTSDVLQPYTYQPLSSEDTIRLLCLNPAQTRTTPLSGSIVHVSRDAELTRPSVYSKYASVSYVWGTADFSQQLQIREDVTHHGEYVLITPEVTNMLTELRKPLKVRYLWIDAICLNQQDDVEKSQQIPLMGQIYSQARKVIFWLGMESDGEIGQLFTYFRHLALRPEGSRTTDEIDNKHETRRHLHQFFQRSWFFRRWILQEMACARHGTLHCGPHTLPWSLFRASCSRIQNNGPLSGVADYGISIVNAISFENHELSGLLWKFHRSICSDERDRIAALYGLLPRTKQMILNYAMPYQDLYKRNAINMLDYASPHELLLHLFSFGALSYPSDSTYPSWVPRWSTERSLGVPIFFGGPLTIPEFETSSGKMVFRAPVLCRFSMWKQQRRQLHIDGNKSEQDWQLWKEWLLTTDCFLDQATILSARKDHYGKDVLNLCWIGTWRYPREHTALRHGFTQGDAYGRSISRVVTLPNRCDWPGFAQRFAPFREGFENHNVNRPLPALAFNLEQIDPDFLLNLGRLAITLERLASWKSLQTLSCWKKPNERRYVLTCALLLLFDEHAWCTKSFAHIIPSMVFDKDYHSTEFFTDFIVEMEDVPSEYLKEIFCEVCISLHVNHLAIGELLPDKSSKFVPFKTYFIGPSTVKQDMVLIPLHTIDGAHQDWFEWTDPATSSFNWANAMVVKPIHHDTMSNSGHIGVEHKENGSIPPNKAIYITMCFLPLFKDTLKPTRFEKATTYFLWSDLAQKKYLDAEQKGLPPPFTIDLV